MLLLPPIFRRNGGGTIFTGVCLFTFRGSGGVTPIWLKGGGYHCPDGGTPSSPDGGKGVPPSSSEKGVSHPVLKWIPPFIPDRGYPIWLAVGTPSWPRGVTQGTCPWLGVDGVTPSGLDGVTPSPS